MTTWNSQPDLHADSIMARIVEETPPKAAGFIVTLYGDVVVPRGGVTWIGNIIDTCAIIGITDTLVRTAVSRLVASNQLIGEREGRHSYYRLSEPAGHEFAAAARILYGPEERPNWTFAHLAETAGPDSMAKMERLGFARIGNRVFVGPRAAPASLDGALTFAASPAAGGPALQAFAAECWDLEPHASAYRLFLAQFEVLENALTTGKAGAPQTFLVLRLMLVHRFRSVALRDPRLPAAALPRDWPGIAARQLFERLYFLLSPAADAHIGHTFMHPAGHLPATTDITRARFTHHADR